MLYERDQIKSLLSVLFVFRRIGVVAGWNGVLASDLSIQTFNDKFAPALIA